MLHSIVELNFGMCKDTVVSSNDAFFFTNAFYVGSDFVFCRFKMTFLADKQILAPFKSFIFFVCVCFYG